MLGRRLVSAALHHSPISNHWILTKILTLLGVVQHNVEHAPTKKMDQQYVPMPQLFLVETRVARVECVVMVQIM